MGKLFGTDGIRGVANTYPMDVETAVAAGKAIAGFFVDDGNGSPKHVVVGQDTRLSGDMLAQAVAAGICAAGVDVWMMGVLPTPAIARMAISSSALAGVVISASHNPFEDNGIKVFDARGYKLPDAAEADIEAMLLGQRPVKMAPSDAVGRVRHIEDAGEQYIAFLQQTLQLQPLQKLTVVLDCANGATFRVAPECLRRLGARVLPMFCNPDGTNINNGCGSQHPESLARAVSEQNADLGLAFDGDGDRLIAVNEKGNILSGDQIIAILASDYKQQGRLRNNAVVTTVMSNVGFRNALKQMDIDLHTTLVGDRYVMETMLAQDAVLGGEDSGHIILRDVHTTGDGLMAAIRLLDVVQRSGHPLSELAKVMTVFPQELINVDVKTKPPLETIPEITHAIETAEGELGDQGRVLVRYSGTQNKCRVMVEGPTQNLTQELCQKIAEVVRKTIG